MKLGKKPFVPDRRDFLLATVANLQTLPPAPRLFGYGSAYKEWLMLGNGPDDTVAPGFAGAGDCVFAGAAHEHMLFGKEARRPIVFSGKEVIGDYSAVTGYVIGDDSTDQGTEPRDAMLYRQKTGILDSAGARHKIGAFVRVPLSYDVLMQAAYWFECVGLGIQFPDTAMDQFGRNQPWDVVPGATIEGGHYIVLTGRRGDRDNGVITWGKRQSATRTFVETYADEAWAFVTDDELRNGVNKRGLDLTRLKALLAQLGH